MGQVFIGTCSWTDRQLINAGTFYPEKAMSAEARLRWYASIFPIVEVDSSYYGVPTEENAQRWAERTPEGFRFHLKMFRLFTGHWCERTVLPTDLHGLAPVTVRRNSQFYLFPRNAGEKKECPDELRDELLDRFIRAALVLESHGKLGVILLQMAPWVVPTRLYTDHLLWIRQKLRHLRVAVEFRNTAWMEGEAMEQTLGWLREHDLSYVSVDAPQGSHTSMPPLAAATNGLAYVRLHGRNVATWQAKVEHTWERFDWYYAEEELQEWVPRIRALRHDTTEVHVLFNPNRSDQGPRGGLLLSKLIDGDGVKADRPELHLLDLAE